MPVKRGSDKQGSYYSYGNNGKKYYYTTNDKESRNLAHSKAIKQGIAIKISQL